MARRQTRGHLSPKLFVTLLEHVFKRLYWSTDWWRKLKPSQLRMNYEKTTFTTNLVTARNSKVQIENSKLMEKYIYLDYEIKIGRDNQTCQMRTKITWVAYRTLRDVFKSVNWKIFNQCEIAVPTNGAKTCTLTLITGNKLKTTQRRIEMSTLE